MLQPARGVSVAHIPNCPKLYLVTLIRKPRLQKITTASPNTSFRGEADKLHYKLDREPDLERLHDCLYSLHFNDRRC